MKVSWDQDGFDWHLCTLWSDRLIIGKLNYKMFKLWQMSLLWRCGASRRAEFKATRLGPHAEVLRTMLLEERPGFGRRGGRELLAVEFGEDKRVNRASGFGRKGGFCRLGKKPCEMRIGRAFLPSHIADGFRDLLYSLRRQRGAQRHAGSLFTLQVLNQQARVRIAGAEGGAVFSALKSALPGVQRQAPGSLRTRMAARAMFREDLGQAAARHTTSNQRGIVTCPGISQ